MLNDIKNKWHDPKTSFLLENFWGQPAFDKLCSSAFHPPPLPHVKRKYLLVCHHRVSCKGKVKSAALLHCDKTLSR